MCSPKITTHCSFSGSTTALMLCWIRRPLFPVPLAAGHGWCSATVRAWSEKLRQPAMCRAGAWCTSSPRLLSWTGTTSCTRRALSSRGPCMAWPARHCSTCPCRYTWALAMGSAVFVIRKCNWKLLITGAYWSVISSALFLGNHLDRFWVTT